ncbi:VOC family protein [Metallibacterium sp.]|uniref:VOC family protein n=1 Tax=Metallibacterium sp. TaxID=2940281 RepID=UPI0026238356|nr:VOC family protein [Metallibacterium sp.]
MLDPNFFILYVDSPAASAAFYADLLGHTPIQASPNFALLALQSGVKLGLRSRREVEPAATVTGGGTELAFAVDSDATVTSMHAEWARRGLPILQAPVRMNFGYTFVAADPDGHRLRVVAPSAP